MAVLVMSAQRRLDYTDFVFSNVGDDSENPDSLRYIEEIAKPYAEQNGLRIHDVKRERRDGRFISILEDAFADNSSISIPVYLKNGGPASRNCTSNWKVKVIERWMRKNANATKENRQPLGVGISIDESHRMRSDDPEREPYVYKEYPLIDLRMTRSDCQRLIVEAGLLLAPKSSCFFCPFKRKSDWVKLRTEKPDLFEIACMLEDRLNEKRVAANKDLVYLTAQNRRLNEAIPLPTVPIFDDDDFNDMFCESGYCMT